MNVNSLHDFIFCQMRDSRTPSLIYIHTSNIVSTCQERQYRMEARKAQAEAEERVRRAREDEERRKKERKENMKRIVEAEMKKLAEEEELAKEKKRQEERLRWNISYQAIIKSYNLLYIR